jgi:hypothetical protein
MKYLIDLEDGVEVIDDTAINARMNEVDITLDDTVVAIGVRTRFNSAAVIRPMSRGTEVSLDIIDNTIKSLEDLLVDMKAERLTVIEHAYQNSHQYIHVFEEGNTEVRDRPKPPVPVSSKYPVCDDEDDDS